MTDSITYVKVTQDNVDQHGVYCIKNKKAAGYQKKVEWFKTGSANGLGIVLAMDQDGKQIGFIEFVPSEEAWRPVSAENYLFIHCLGVFTKKVRGQSIGSGLISAVEHIAKRLAKNGVCAMTSDGPWMANRQVFENNGYVQTDKRGRFELMCKAFHDDSPQPALIDWEQTLPQYDGWHLLYADQCPWHDSSVGALQNVAMERDVPLQVTKLKTSEEARHSPAGYGTFCLIHDGRVLADHYISATRFKNILKAEIKE